MHTIPWQGRQALQLRQADGPGCRRVITGAEVEGSQFKAYLSCNIKAKGNLLALERPYLTIEIKKVWGNKDRVQ